MGSYPMGRRVGAGNGNDSGDHQEVKGSGGIEKMKVQSQG